MRKAPLLLVALAAAATLVASARADGVITSPSAMSGGSGVLAPDGKVRYVAIPGRGETIVAAVRVRGGAVLRWRPLRGGFGVPVVAFDGTTGGLSGDGTTLVLATPTYNPGPVSRFPVLSTATFRPRGTITLRGSWSFDAISPDGATVFLVEYLSAGRDGPYRVRAFDLDASRLLGRAIVDRREGEALMRGQPVTRGTSRDGRWAYTLYARRGDEPFVHALDTVRREAFCIDLPLRLGQGAQMGLRLELESSGAELAVRRGVATVAVVDTRTFEARRS